MVSALGRTALNPGYTQADITLFRFDAAGAQPSMSGVGGSASMVDHTLRKAIAVCEAMQLLASLGGTERQREMNLAEDIGTKCI